MATYIDLDSIWRDRETWPNPANFQLSVEQVRGWFAAARSVNALPKNPSTQPLGFVISMNIHYLTLPYDASIAGLPRVYLNIRSKSYKDINLIQSIDGKQRDARFICTFDRVQNDGAGDPLWIHYRCSMEQVFRFKMNDELIFSVTTRSGDVIPNFDTTIPADADPDKQILCTFDVTPYRRDGSYSEDAQVQPLNT